MAISKKISEFMEKSSWIRKMFEEGILLKKQFGEENVFDLSLGNPVVEPPTELREAMITAASDTAPGLHRYMPNAGFPDVREAIARSLSPACKVELSGDHVVLVCGAAGGLNITLKTLLDPGADENDMISGQLNLACRGKGPCNSLADIGEASIGHVAV